MHGITNACIEKEIESILRHGAFTYGNLERFNMLCEAMKNLSKIRHEFTAEDAKLWAQHMDPPARWTMEQTSAVMQQSGYAHDPYVFYAVMNMLASDMGKTISRFGYDRTDLWAALAHDWICDSDAVPDKIGRYWRDIVSHKK